MGPVQILWLVFAALAFVLCGLSVFVLVQYHGKRFPHVMRMGAGVAGLEGALVWSTANTQQTGPVVIGIVVTLVLLWGVLYIVRSFLGMDHTPNGHSVDPGHFDGRGRRKTDLSHREPSAQVDGVSTAPHGGRSKA